MNSETRLLIEIWENVRDVIASSHRQAAANQIVISFNETGGYDSSDLSDILDEDVYLRNAYRNAFGDEESDFDEEEDE